MLNWLVEWTIVNATCGKADIYTNRLRRCRTKVATKCGISEAVVYGVINTAGYVRCRSLHPRLSKVLPLQGNSTSSY